MADSDSITLRRLKGCSPRPCSERHGASHPDAARTIDVECCKFVHWLG